MRKTLRALLLLAGAVLLGFVVLDYTASTSLVAPNPAETTPTLPVSISSQAERWTWTQSAGDNARIEVYADSQDTSDDAIELRGVELRVFHDDEGSYDRIVSDAASLVLAENRMYSDGETIITLGIPVEGEVEKPTVVTTSGVTFYTRTSQAHTDRQTGYVFDGGQGRSVGAIYDSITGVLHMKSDVHFERFEVEGGPATTVLTAGKLDYHEQQGRIDVFDGARVERGAQWLECTRGLVQLENGIVRKIEANDAVGGEAAGDRDVRFTTDRFEAYYSEARVLEQISGVGATKFQSFEEANTLTIKGQRMDLFYASLPEGEDSTLERIFVRESSSILMEPRTEGLRRLIRSEVLELHMMAGGENIERIETLEPGRIELTPVLTKGTAKTLDASRIKLEYAGNNVMKSLLASGSVRLVRAAAGPEDAPLLTWSEGLLANFGEDDGEMSDLRQWEKFRFEQGPRSGAAGEGQFDIQANLLDLTDKAAVSDPGGRITAHRIRLDQSANRIEAESNVASSHANAPKQSGKGEPAPKGLFAEGEPVFATAQRMVSDQEQGVLEYHGQARLWQGANRVEAEHIVIDRGAKVLTARENVVSTLQEAGGAGKRPSAVTVRSREMRYAEASQTAHFSGDVDFRRQKLAVRSERLIALMASEGNESGRLKSAEAIDSVEIEEQAAVQGRTGFGDRAVYQPDSGQVDLKGAPARVVSAAGDETRGGSLTYQIDDDRLQVSGGGERTYTYRRPK